MGMTIGLYILFVHASFIDVMAEKDEEEWPVNKENFEYFLKSVVHQWFSEGVAYIKK